MARRRAAPAPVAVETSQGLAELVGDPRRAGARTLFIGGLASAHVDLSDPTVLHMDYLHRLAVALDALRPRRGGALDVVHLGGGAFALPRWIAATRPAARQEAYELEPALVALAREHLRLRRSPGLRVRTGDAAALLGRRSDASADVVVGDAFTATEIPRQLASAEFARDVHRVLRDDGVYLLNVVDAPPWRASRAQERILRDVFGHVVVFGAREVVRGRRAGNVLLAAAAVPLPRAALARGLAGGPFPAEVRS